MSFGNALQLPRVSYSIFTLAKYQLKCWTCNRLHQPSFLDANQGCSTVIKFISTEPEKHIETENAVKLEQRPRRKRHVFRGKKLENVPSFHDFQLQTQIRHLYRRYIRLVWHNAAATTSNSTSTGGIRRDIMATIKSEFRRVPNSDPWETKRALSEGNRRYKELASMLNTTSMTNLRNKEIKSPHEQNDARSETMSSTNVWPWHNNNPKIGNTLQRPLPFPPKSK